MSQVIVIREGVPIELSVPRNYNEWRERLGSVERKVLSDGFGGLFKLSLKKQKTMGRDYNLCLKRL